MENLNELLGEELYNKVSEKLGDKKLLINDGSYIPKSKFDETNTAKSQLKEQVGQLSTQLESLKELSKGNTELEKKIADLQKTNTDWESKYQKSTVEAAIKLEAIKHNAINPEDILAFVKNSDLTIDDAGKVKGLTDQFTELKKNKAYLFQDDKSTTTKPGTNPAGRKDTSDGLSDKLKKSFGL